MSGEADQTGTIARLAAQRTKYRDAARAAIKDRKAQATELERARQELEGLRKAGSPARIAELEGELRTLRHRSAFDRAAKARGAADEDLDDLFTLSGYKATGDDVDDKALGKLLDGMKEHPARKRYFAAPAGDGDDEGEGEGLPAGRAPGREEITPERRPAPPADAGRGGRPRPEGSVILTADQLSDPRFMLDPRNAELKSRARVRL